MVLVPFKVLFAELEASATVCSTHLATWAAVNSVLAIGGVGGLAVGLAGREILENLFTGLIILSSSPFEVGEEISFTSSSSRVRQLRLALVSSCVRALQQFKQSGNVVAECVSLANKAPLLPLTKPQALHYTPSLYQLAAHR